MPKIVQSSIPRKWQPSTKQSIAFLYQRLNNKPLYQQLVCACNRHQGVSSSPSSNGRRPRSLSFFRRQPHNRLVSRRSMTMNTIVYDLSRNTHREDWAIKPSISQAINQNSFAVDSFAPIGNRAPPGPIPYGGAR